MKWQKSPEALVQQFAGLVPEDPRVGRRQMFGYPCAVVNGHLFMGLHQDSMILRLSDDDRAEFLALRGAGPFEPMPGRPMREYVVVPPGMLSRTAALSGWIRRALGYARSLPPKQPGRRGSAKRRGLASRRRPARA